MSDTKELLNDPIEHVMEAAKIHGDDVEADHEVGDLQDLLRAMWALLPADKRTEFLSSDAVMEVLKAGSIEEDLPYIHGDWTHLFSIARREDAVRFVFDTRDNRIVAMQVADGPVGGSYVNATSAQIADVEDSLKNANPGALEDPDDWGLTRAYEPPAWAIEVGLVEREPEPVVRDVPRA